MITLPVILFFFLIILVTSLGFLLALFVTKPDTKKEIQPLINMYVDGATSTRKIYEKEAIARGYGEMYDKEISPDKHPGLTIPSFRWINPEGFVEETKENKQ